MEMELEAYLATRANAAAGDAPPILADGTHVGEWTVTGFIGRGGSSEVYCASATQGHVALKVLVRDTPAQRARFTHETALLRDIAHPAFPRILGAVAVHQLILSLLLNTLWISLLYGSPYAPLLLSRLPQCALLAAVQLAVIPLIAHILPQIRGGAA